LSGARAVFSCAATTFNSFLNDFSCITACAMGEPSNCSIDIRCCYKILQQSLPDLLITGTLLPISKVLYACKMILVRYKQTVPLTMIK
jgi:hypothetical protein